MMNFVLIKTKKKWIIFNWKKLSISNVK